MLSDKLLDIAYGKCYDESVLKQALKLPCLSTEDKTIIKCWLVGVVDKSGSKFHRLQQIALKIAV